ncbi:MAG: hypothetical protein H7X97_11785 [Opitutaceae bacterium]|nr:hypothetical protein [Verrucomicrobiales bacterium]
MGGRGIDDDGVEAGALGSPKGDGVGSAGLGSAGEDGGGSLAPEIPGLALGAIWTPGSVEVGEAGFVKGGAGNGVVGLIAAGAGIDGLPEGLVEGGDGGFGNPVTGVKGLGVVGVAGPGGDAIAPGPVGFGVGVAVETAGRRRAGWVSVGECGTIFASPFGPNKSPTSAGACSRFTGARRANPLGPMSERIVCSGNST